MMPASSDARGMTATYGFHNREGCDWSVVSFHEESSDFMAIVVGSEDFFLKSGYNPYLSKLRFPGLQSVCV